MASAVDICNDALGYLGQDGSLTSIDPPNNSAHARVMARLYPRARTLVLASRNWQFATKRSDVLLDTGSTLPMWEFAYAQPSDVVRPIAVLPSEAASDDDVLPFLYENGLLYCNAESVVLRYVYDHTNTQVWSALFCDAVARRLAAMAFGTLVRGADVRLAATLDNNAELALAVAGEHDGLFTRPEETYQTPWIKVRV